MRNPSLTAIAGACALLTTTSFVVGSALMAGSGVQVLIPETGQEGLDWIADVDAAGAVFAAGAWLTVLGGLFGLVAFVGFYEPLREAHRALIVVPVVGAVSMVFVTISHALPIAMSYGLVPSYLDAVGPAREAIGANFDMWAVTCLVFTFLAFFVWMTALGGVLFCGSRSERDEPVPVLG